MVMLEHLSAIGTMNGFQSQSAGALRALIASGTDRARRQHHNVLVAYTIPVQWIDPIDVYSGVTQSSLLSLQHTDRVLWMQPSQDFSMVGVGAAVVLQSSGTNRFARIAAQRTELLSHALIETDPALDGLQTIANSSDGQTQINPGLTPTFFGGFRFDAQYPADNRDPRWQSFGDARFVLPQLTLTQTADHAVLTFAVMVNPMTDADDTTNDLLDLADQVVYPFISRKTAARPGNLCLTDVQDSDTWQATVRTAADRIAAESPDSVGLRKVALARSIHATRSGGFDLTESLRSLSAQYPDCYVFAIGQTDTTFIGATPERLMQLVNGHFQTMSLAGSARRGSTPETDAQLSAALLRSAKDLEEHAQVVAALAEMLHDYAEELTIPAAPGLLQLKNVQHLWTPIHGQLSADHTLLDLVARLHPTPAVGGRPQQAAVDFIREHEGMDRGWYAAPIGWIDANGNGEFAVALRCALVQKYQAVLYAGCGIVGSSDPAREFAETNLKFRPMIAALGG